MSNQILDKIKKVKDQFFQATLSKITPGENGDKHRVRLYLIYRITNAVMLWGTILISTITGSTLVFKLINLL